MEFFPGTGPSAAAASAARLASKLPRHCRHKIRSLAYVNINQSNGGIIRDLSEIGVALQAVAPLHSGDPVQLRLELHNPRVQIETTGSVRWANNSGQAGVQFHGLSQHARQLLKDWLFIQLLAAGQPIYGKDSIFATPGPAETAPELMISGSPRPPIRIATPPASAAQLFGQVETAAMEFSWLTAFFSARALAGIIDGLLLLTAVLLFAGISLAIVRSFPRWPVSALLGITVTCSFAALYWTLFVGRLGATPGIRLAHAATCNQEDGLNAEPEPRTRFR